MVSFSPDNKYPLKIKGNKMVTERTLSIIKPDITKSNQTGGVNALIEKAGLKIVAQKMIYLSRREAGLFYAEHYDRPFFEELVEFMVSAPVVVQVLEGEGAVATYRKIMGATNPEEADEGTIRRTFSKSIGENSVHGSDSIESAQREIGFFFGGIEIVS